MREEKILHLRSLVLVLLMVTSYALPMLSPFEPEEELLVEDNPRMQTNTGPQLVVNVENKMGFGSSNIDRNHGFVNGPNGSAYIIGEFQGTLTFGTYSLTSSGSYFDGYVAKLNNQGNWEWAVKLGGTSTDRTYGLAVDSSGDAFVTGNFYGTCHFYDKAGQSSGSLVSAGSADLYVAKLKHDASDWHWMAKIGSSGTSEGGNDIVLDNWGDAYISGYIGDNSSIWDKGNTYWNSSYTNGGQDAFVGKISSSGNWQWVQTGGSSANDAAIRLDYAGNGSVVTGGSYRGQATFGNINLSHWQDKEAFVAKVDSNGWIFAKGGTGNGDNQVSSVKVDSSGDIYYITKFSGNLTMSAGFTSGFSNTAVVGKISGSSFQYLWHNTTSSLGAVNPINIAISANGDLTVVGDFDGTVYFGNGQQFTRSGTGQNGYVQGFNASNGHTKYAFTIGNGGTGDDIVVNDLAFDPGAGGATGGSSAYNTLILAGYFKGTATFGPGDSLTSAGNEDGFLAKVKFTEEGCYINGSNNNNIPSHWEFCSGSSDSVSAQDVVVDSSGNSYYTGYFSGTAVIGSSILTSSGDKDIFVAKLNSSGSWQWVIGAGGSGPDVGNAISLHSASNQIYVTGAFRGVATFGTSTLNSGGTNIQDIFVAKLSSSGSWQWVESAGGSYSDEGRDIVVDSTGWAYVTGHFQSPSTSSATFGTHSITSAGANDIFVAKISPTGSWGCAVRAGGSSWDAGRGIALGNSGNVYVTGGFEGTATFGSSTSLTSSGQSDIFIAKLSSSCTWQSAFKEGGSGGDGGNDITLDSSNKIYVTGYFGSTVNFGNSVSLTSSGVEDIFVWKLDQSNNPPSTSWAVKAGSSSSDYGRSLAVDSSGHVYLVGHFQGTPTFGNLSTISSTGSYDIFFAQISNSGIWTTRYYWGSSGSDSGNGFALDSSGSNVYFAGKVSSGTAYGDNEFICGVNSCGIFVKFVTPSVPLAIETTSLPNAEVGTGYSYIVNASGGTGNYTWTVTSGSVPGINLISWGLFTGTPTAAGTYQVTIQVSDGTSTVSKNLSLLVNAASSPAIFNSSADWNSIESENSHSVALGDVDGDGDLDLAVANALQNNRLYLNDGNNFSTSPVWTSSNSLNSRDMAWGDVDGDGDLDLAVANHNGKNEIYFNSGTGLTTTPGWQSSNSWSSVSVSWGDIDGDGDLDLAVSNQAHQNEVYLNDGSTLGTNSYWTSSNSLNTNSAIWGDVDGDGDLDLAVGSYDTNNEVYLNDGSTLENTPSWTSSNSQYTMMLAWGDIDGDGDLDLAVGNRHQSNEIYLNTGTSLSTTPSFVTTETTSTNWISLGDLDGDGDLDMIAGNREHASTNSSSSNQVYFNSGSTLESSATWTGNARETYGTALGDVDGDGDLDLVVANKNSESNELFFNQLNDGGAGADGLPDIDIGGPSDSDSGGKNLATGYSHNCAIQKNQTISCWGSNQYGQLGSNQYGVYDYSSPLYDVDLPQGTVPISVTAGWEFTCAILSGSSTDAYCWGRGQNGRLGNGDDSDSSIPADKVGIPGDAYPVDISSGYEHSCLVSQDGDVYCWGSNSHGQLGNGTSGGYSSTAGIVNGPNVDYTSVAVGEHHSCALTTEDDLYCWGHNGQGQLGDGTWSSSATPVLVSGSITWKSVVPNGMAGHSCAISSSDELYCWGSNGEGQLGDGSYSPANTPQLVQLQSSATSKVVDASVGSFGTSCAFLEDSSTYCWGFNARGNLGDGTWQHSTTPVSVSLPEGSEVLEISSGREHSCALLASDQIMCWGIGNWGVIGNGKYDDAGHPNYVSGEREWNGLGKDFYHLPTSVSIGTDNSVPKLESSVSFTSLPTSLNVDISSRVYFSHGQQILFFSPTEVEQNQPVNGLSWSNEYSFHDELPSITGGNDYCVEIHLNSNLTGDSIGYGLDCVWYNPPSSQDDFAPDDFEDVWGTSTTTQDSDGDGYEDWFEYWFGGDPLDSEVKPSDADMDGLPDALELAINSDENSVDTDGDGHEDIDELIYGGHPLKPWTVPPNYDYDDCYDYWENWNGLNSSNSDTDGDGVIDCMDTDSLDPDNTPVDSDGDGMPDDMEEEFGSDPENWDSDGDGMPDSFEYIMDTDPNSDQSWSPDWAMDWNTVLSFGQDVSITASSSHSEHPASLAIDSYSGTNGNQETYWQTNGYCPATLEVDLGRAQYFSTIDFLVKDIGDQNFPRNISIEYRETTEDTWNLHAYWERNVPGANGDYWDGMYAEMPFSKARYVRLNCTDSTDSESNSWEIAIASFRVYGIKNTQYINPDGGSGGGAGQPSVEAFLNIDPANQTLTAGYSAQLNEGLDYDIEWRLIEANEGSCSDVPLSIDQGTVNLMSWDTASNGTFQQIPVDYSTISDWYDEFCFELDLMQGGTSLDVDSLFIDATAGGNNENFITIRYYANYKGWAHESGSHYDVIVVEQAFSNCLLDDGDITDTEDTAHAVACHYLFGHPNSNWGSTYSPSANDPWVGSYLRSDGEIRPFLLSEMSGLPQYESGWGLFIPEDQINQISESSTGLDLPILDFLTNTSNYVTFTFEYSNSDGSNNGGNGSNQTQTDTDGDGVDDLIDLCAGTAPGVQVDSTGCPIGDPTTHNTTISVEFIEQKVDGVWNQKIELLIEDPWGGYNHSLSFKLEDSNGNTLYSYFSPIDEEEYGGWAFLFLETDGDEMEWKLDLNWEGVLEGGYWQSSSRFFEDVEYPYFEAGEYCVEVSLGYQINASDTAMSAVKNLFDKEVFCGTFEHDSMEGVSWDGVVEPEQGLIDKVASNAVVSAVMDFMNSTTGQIISILLGVLAFAGRMVLARGQRAKNKRVRKLSQRIRRAETIGRLKIIEQDVEKANDKNKLPRGGYGDLMEQIEAQMEKLGFDGNPQDGGTSGDWSSDEGANEWQDDFQQAADMMWDAQDMMAEAKEEAAMARNAIEDMQQQMGLESRYDSAPVVEKKRYERTGLKLSDSAQSAGPSLPSSKFGQGGSGSDDNLISSILSKNIAPKDPCHCGSKKLYKDCHMKRDRARRERKR